MLRCECLNFETCTSHQNFFSKSNSYFASADLYFGFGSNLAVKPLRPFALVSVDTVSDPSAVVLSNHRGVSVSELSCDVKWICTQHQ